MKFDSNEKLEESPVFEVRTILEEEEWLTFVNHRNSKKCHCLYLAIVKVVVFFLSTNSLHRLSDTFSPLFVMINMFLPGYVSFSV